jgi:hypothetical protein
MVRSQKIKSRNDYNLSGVGVGVLPALNIPQISGGAMTYYSQKWGPTTSAVNSGANATIAPIVTDRKTIEMTKSLHHMVLPTTHKHLQDKPIKHTNKKKNFMSIFERGEAHKKK